MTRALLVAVATIAAASFTAPTAAEPYGACVIGEPASPADQSTWVYRLVNCSASTDYSIFVLQIDVDANAFVIDAGAPPGSGWSTYFEQPNPDHYVMWICDPSELQANEELSGFRVVFTQRPSCQGWSAQFHDSQNIGTLLVQSGEVVTIEPGACAALLTGLISVTAFAIKRRR